MRGLGIVKRHLDEFKFDPNLQRMAKRSSSSSRGDLEAALVEGFRRALEIVDGVDVFVASFFDSTKFTMPAGQDAGDSLDQWRAYSRDNSGFSIGFDKILLSKHIAQIGDKPSRPIASGTCNYDSDFQDRYLRDRIYTFGSEIISRIYSLIGDYVHENRPQVSELVKPDVKQTKTEEEIVEEVLRKLVDSLGSFAEVLEVEFKRLNREVIEQLINIMIPVAFMKHPAFGAENEWRIAQFAFRPTSQINFRTGISSLIPYVEIALPIGKPNLTLLKRIVVGPSPKIDEAVRAAKMLLRCKGYQVKEHGCDGGIEVVPSQLPFRTW